MIRERLSEQILSEPHSQHSGSSAFPIRLFAFCRGVADAHAYSSPGLESQLVSTRRYGLAGAVDAPRGDPRGERTST